MASDSFPAPTIFTFNSVTQLGFTSGDSDTTMADVFAALPTYSIALFTGNNFPASEFPGNSVKGSVFMYKAGGLTRGIIRNMQAAGEYRRVFDNSGPTMTWNLLLDVDAETSESFTPTVVSPLPDVYTSITNTHCERYGKVVILTATINVSASMQGTWTTGISDLPAPNLASGTYVFASFPTTGDTWGKPLQTRINSSGGLQCARGTPGINYNVSITYIAK